MTSRRRRILDVSRAVLYEVRTENLTFMAGSIAYHAFVSMLPLLVLVLVAVGSLADERLAERVFDVVETVLTPTGRSLVTEAVSGETVSGLSVLGVALLVWATLRIFRGLDQAFSDIYESEPENTLLDQVGDGLLVLLTVLGAAVVAGTVRSYVAFGGGPVGTVLGAVFVVVGLTVALFPMYYLFPDVDIRPVGAVPGAVVAAVGVTALESSFRLYVQFSSTSDSYGVFGGILVLVTWLYFNGLVILLGAVVNAVLTNRTEDVDVSPVIGSYRPGIGRTVGAPVGDDTDERDAVGTRLRTVADRFRTADDADRSVVLQVGGDEVRLPPPESVDVDADPDGGVGIELRW